MTLKDLYDRNRAMPNGGAKLLEARINGWWAVGDGSWHYGTYPTQESLRLALKLAGFKSHNAVWQNTVYWHTY